MEYAVEPLPPEAVDSLRLLWLQLFAHHARLAPHLETLGELRVPADSWRLRREQYLEWLRAPSTKAFVARRGERVVGYAMVRVVEATGSWQWGDRVGVLESLVVDADARGLGIGRALTEAARTYLAGKRIQVMKISVIAGNDDAVRFYQRESALAFVQTLVMPVDRTDT